MGLFSRNDDNLITNQDFMRGLGSTGYEDSFKLPDMGNTVPEMPKELAIRIPASQGGIGTSVPGMDFGKMFGGLFESPTLEKGQVQGLSPVMQGLGAFKDIVGIYSGIKGIKAGEKQADAAMGQLNLARDSYNTAKAEQQRQIDKERKYQELLNKTYNS